MKPSALSALQQSLTKPKVLNIFFTAGYPYLDATPDILKALEHTSCDMVEIGIPFSDPLSDGLVIQASSEIALQNGMSIDTLWKQLQDVRTYFSKPILLMGYLNPVLQYGFERFLKKCQSVGVAATILPDLPLDRYESQYQSLYEKYGVANVFLITPQTSPERIARIAKLTKAFIYVLSQNAVTGVQSHLSSQKPFFERLSKMRLKAPTLVGFGIKQKADVAYVCQYAQGAIIGSAFVSHLQGASKKELPLRVQEFVSGVK